MPTKTTAPGLTAEQFFEFVSRRENDGRRWQLVRGMPEELPGWPAEFTAAHLRIVVLLQEYVIRRGAGSIAFRGDGLITRRNPDTVRSPAVMVFLGPPPDEFPPRFTAEVPSLVVELPSPGEGGGRVMQRMIEYVEFGVPLMWSVEPDDPPGLSVYRPKQPPHVPDDGDDLLGYDALPGFRLPVRELFAPAVPVKDSRK